MKLSFLIKLFRPGVYKLNLVYYFKLDQYVQLCRSFHAMIIIIMIIAVDGIVFNFFLGGPEIFSLLKPNVFNCKQNNFYRLNFLRLFYPER